MLLVLFCKGILRPGRIGLGNFLGAESLRKRRIVGQLERVVFIGAGWKHLRNIGLWGENER